MTACVSDAAPSQKDLHLGIVRFVQAAAELERGYAELRGRADAVAAELQVTNQALAKALREREAMLTALPLGVMSVAADGSVLASNPEAERMGAAARQHGLDLSRCASGEHEFAAERVRIRRVPMPDGELVVVEDRTRVRVLEQENQRLDQLAHLSEVALGIAHEIKNPLNGVLGFAALTERATDLATARRYAGRIVAGVERIDEIVRGLLEFACGSHGKRRTAAVQAALTEAISNAGFPASHVEAFGDLDAQIDAQVLERVVANLLTNSLGAFAEARVTVVATARHGRLQLLVRDDGPGIAPHLRERIFQPFVTSKERGCGLGLALAMRLLRLLGGEIELLPPDGRGAAFRIGMPLAAGVTK